MDRLRLSERTSNADPLGFVGHTAQACVLHQPDVLRKRAAIGLVWRHLPGFAARGEFVIGEIHAQQVLLGIDGDAVAAADQARSARLPEPRA